MRSKTALWGAVLSLLPAAALGQGQTPAAAPAPMTYIWAPKHQPTPFVAPNRPHWKLSNILAAHSKTQSWSQLVVRDADGLSGTYIQMAPGEKTKTALYVDAGLFWVVQAGQIRVTIEGQAPFVASKGFIVQVPPRVAFSMETVSDVPSLRFEVTHTRATLAYPLSEKPTPLPGVKYIRTMYAGGPGSYGTTKPYLDFNKEIVQTGARAPAGWVRDGETSANLIRGPGVETPPAADPGHFHDGTSEFWFVLEGHMNLLIEGEPLVTGAEQGDILYSPPGRWHRTNLVGPGMSTRIAIHPIALAAANLDPEYPGLPN